MKRALMAFSHVQFRSVHRAELQEIQQKLRRMTELQRGWSYGEGKPVSAKATKVAEDLVEKILGLGLDADVFPNLDGGCAAVAYQGEKSIEVSISAKGVLERATTERGIGPSFEVVEKCQRPTRRDVTLALNKLAGRRSGEVEWMSSGCWTSSTTIAEGNDFGIWSIEIPHAYPTQPARQTARAVSRSSEFRVFGSEPSASARMSRSTIRESLGLPVGFGVLAQQTSSRQRRTPRRLSHPS